LWGHHFVRMYAGGMNWCIDFWEQNY
jgi:hypothetical protein